MSGSTSCAGLGLRKLSTMAILLVQVILLLDATLGYPMELQSPGLVQRLCGDSSDVRACVERLRPLLAGLGPENQRRPLSAPEDGARPVMTSPMLRVLPCTLARCATAVESRSDLFACIRAKCIYQSYTQLPVPQLPAAHNPPRSLSHLEAVIEAAVEDAKHDDNDDNDDNDDASDIDAPLHHQQPHHHDNSAVKMSEMELFRRSEVACFRHCKSLVSGGEDGEEEREERDEEDGEGRKVAACVDSCRRSLLSSSSSGPADLRKLLLAPRGHPEPRVPSPRQTVNKRWSSRLCMEAHCKRFEVNGGQWFRCGQNHCGR